ncbi:MAG: peptide chain release factor N(5)-glutamine methyltransferase [Patescibacteria group bacterium]
MRQPKTTRTAAGQAGTGRVTVRDVLRNTDLRALDGEVLLASVLKRPRSWLLAHPDAPVPRAVCQRFAVLAARRGTGEPVAYLTGRKEFYGREFAVCEDVLCPRPDTEALVERILKAVRPGDVVFDIGTGSGCVGVTVVLERPDVSAILTDVSEAALKVAERNARRLGAKVRTVPADGLPGEASAVDPKRLVIAGNLPYLDASNPSPPFEPSVALDGGPDGLQVIRALVMQLRERALAPRHLLLEHGESQGAAVRDLLGPRARTSPDLAGNDRVTGY